LKVRFSILVAVWFALYGVTSLYSASAPPSRGGMAMPSAARPAVTPTTATPPDARSLAAQKRAAQEAQRKALAEKAKKDSLNNVLNAKNQAERIARFRAAAAEVAAAEKNKPLKPLRYKVRNFFPQQLEETQTTPSIDLKTPGNIKTTVEYDPVTGLYNVVTRLGDAVMVPPIPLTASEYMEYLEQRSTASYWKEKNKIDYAKKKNAFSLTDLQFDLGLGDKVFGEGGVRLKTQGSIETKFGLKTNIVDNPSLSERARNRTRFNFDQNIQMSVNGKVGDKIDVNMNYDTEAAFDYDTKAIKLRYDGKEDEIIRSLEAGNVSMPVNSQLITGGSALFGVKAGLQFGKLNVAAVVSQQQTQTKTVNLSGGVQKSRFELKADEYDENRHFFLSGYFRNHYEDWIQGLPYIASGIVIKKVEVWVTNKSYSMDAETGLNHARNIVAFADLGEPNQLFNAYWMGAGTGVPDNGSNTLYAQLLSRYADARTFSKVNTTLEPLSGVGVQMGTDYERLESARKLESSEYTLNPTLGYLSLHQALRNDEMLAVAYEYTYNGKTYQVGEFSTDGIEAPSTLFVKTIKGTDFSPVAPTWKLMMKNVYSLRAYNLQADEFKLDISYKSDSVGTYLNYLTEGNLKNKLLLRVLGLDKLNNKDQAYPDGVFDFKEGYTVQAANGCIIFPVLEPFGSDLRRKIGNDALADKYVYQALYDSTLTVAQQQTEKNKFLISGEYKASSGSTLSLGAMRVSPGSVKVTAGGQTLTENVDYTVDYASRSVTILNESLLRSGTPIQATCEDQSTYSMMRKSMLGMTADYKFSDNFTLGGTVMRLSETPLTTKVDMGSESVNNTLWGLNGSFKTESQFLTNLLDKLPFVSATKPSRLSLTGEVAQLIAGSSKTMDDMSYVDDFEASKKTVSLKDPSLWFLASTPYDPSGMFTEASKENDLSYGYNRSLLAWYSIDGIFTQSGTSQTPGHIRNDLDQLSNHYVRLVQEKEIFPNRQKVYNQTGILSVLNLAYYPKERGPYNFDVDGMGTDGYLTKPETRWGGIMRRIETGYTNFESNNVEYVEFWMMDPFIYDSTGVARGGDLYLNLGDISEDVLRDGKRSFENGLPTTASESSLISSTVWGKVSNKTATVYAFDNTNGVRDAQDVGLDGLKTDEEKNWPGFVNYLEKVRGKLNPEALARMERDPFSPLNDPSGDNFHYYRGSDYDAHRTGILERYKHFNGTEGNSQSADKSGEKYSTAGTTLPDVEDINQDFTLNETERYYQYKVSIRPEDMKVGQNYINDVRTSSLVLRNGKVASVKWYQFKVPVREYQKRIGTISGFNSIRFMRLFLTNFQDSVMLRLATLDLVRGDWRNYTKELYTVAPITQATVDVSTVSLEENSGRTPINYKLPPGVKQESDPSQPGVYLEDEQSLMFRVKDLSPADARAVYKNTSYDFRQYERLQLFVHAEALLDDPTPPKDYEMSVFMRLGSDNQSNYYEYEIPLEISPPYVNTANSIWPSNNFFNIVFDRLTALKTRRNASGVNLTKPFSEYDADHGQNKMTVVGNPSLADVSTIMVGVRNKGNVVKSVEIWMNELRLKGFHEEGGWAAVGNAALALSDLATVNASGKFVSQGFGGLEQSVSERSLVNHGQYTLSMNMNAGKLFPEKAKISIPIYYSVSNDASTPKYDPLNEDLLLKDVLAAAHTKAQKDSILNYSQDLNVYRSINFSDVRLGLRSATPMPFDPANFSFRYMNTDAYQRNATTEYAVTRKYDGGVTYAYTSPLEAWTPFARSKSKWLQSNWMKLIKDFNLNPLPNSLSASTNLLRDYFEKRSRDLASSGSGVEIPLVVSKNFLWNSDLDLNWSITKNLKLRYGINNKAMVEETATSPVNKKRYATEYQNWKDTVSRSLKEFGTPLSYNQTTNLSWQVPLNRIPALDFITGTTAQYNAQYDWNRSATSKTQVDIGNTISNQRSLSFGTTINLLNLYNKSAFLSAVNKASDASAQKRTTPTPTPPKTPPAAPGRRSDPVTGANPTKPVVPELKKFNVSISLNADSSLLVSHGLKNKRIYVTAVDSAGKPVAVRTRVKDENSLLIKADRNVRVKLTVFQKAPLEDKDWYRVASTVSRLLMSVRNLTVNYTQNDGMNIPGFRPESNLFRSDPQFGSAPGWDFALGMQSDSYLRRSLEKGWLMAGDSSVNISSPAIQTRTSDLRLKSAVEVVKGLKIDLNASRTWRSNNEIQYMYDGMPQRKTGSFSMTTVLLASAFESPKAKNRYASAAFERFLDNRAVVQSRLEGKMQGRRYPNAGFLSGGALAGTVYNPSNGSFSQNSGDVLIPSFLAAYTGKKVNSADLNLFPSLWSLLPNWSVTYDGLTKLPWFKEKFKNFTLRHAYTCTYEVSSFASYSSWLDAGDGFGFVRDVLNGTPTPSSLYDVGSVSLIEAFSPLLKIQGTLQNGLTLSAESRKTRSLTLSVSAGQVIESKQDQLTLGTNYKVSDFHPWGFLENSKMKNDLSVSGNLTYKNTYSLLRKIKENYAQASSGNKTFVLELQGDYAISKNLNVTLYYDLESSVPLVSNYPVTSSDFGFSMRFSLNR
jgi:cell surface protein SprA